MDREEFFRLKKVKNVKERVAAEEERNRQRKKKKDDSDEEDDVDKENGDVENGQVQDEPQPNLLGDEGDEDVIF